jgi:hypothetical protein
MIDNDRLVVKNNVDKIPNMNVETLQEGIQPRNYLIQNLYYR